MLGAPVPPAAPIPADDSVRTILIGENLGVFATHSALGASDLLAIRDERDVDRLFGKDVGSRLQRRHLFRLVARTRLLRLAASEAAATSAPRARPQKSLRLPCGCAVLLAVAAACLARCVGPLGDASALLVAGAGPATLSDRAVADRAAADWRRPVRVICAGNRRSGSTWQFHAVKLILQLANPGRPLWTGNAWKPPSEDPETARRMIPGFGGPPDPAPTPPGVRRSGRGPADYSVLKVHEFHPEYERAATHVFACHRDPRDVLHSVKRIGMEWEAGKNLRFAEARIARGLPPSCAEDPSPSVCALEAFWDQYERWTRSPKLRVDMRYEALYEHAPPGGHKPNLYKGTLHRRRDPRGEAREIQRLIDALGFPHVTVEAVRHGLRQVEIAGREWAERHGRSRTMRDFLRGEKRSISNWDRNGTWMNAEHIRHPEPGAYRTLLSDEEVEAVEARFGAWMRRTGYALEGPARSGGGAG
jgi:hypothetical protein